MPLSPTALHQLAPTGSLRAAINLGNPVLTAGDAQSPTGVTVDLAREIARVLGLPVELACVHAARDSFAALIAREVDLVFLAVEPVREEHVRFSDPYLAIEGVYAVRPGSTLTVAEDVDQAGIEVGVRDGSAYDLFLTRALQHATVVRGKEPTDSFEEHGLDVVAGIRQPIEVYAKNQALTVLEPPFMQIRQAVGLPRSLDAHVAEAVFEIVDDLKSSGFVEASLTRGGHGTDN